MLSRLTDRVKTAALVCCYPCGRTAWIWQRCEHGPFAVLALADLLGRLNWRWQAFRHRKVMR